MADFHAALRQCGADLWCCANSVSAEKPRAYCQFAVYGQSVGTVAIPCHRDDGLLPGVILTAGKRVAVPEFLSPWATLDVIRRVRGACGFTAGPRITAVAGDGGSDGPDLLAKTKVAICMAICLGRDVSINDRTICVVLAVHAGFVSEPPGAEA